MPKGIGYGKRRGMNKGGRVRPMRSSVRRPTRRTRRAR